MKPPVGCVIFDLDGVLVHTDRFHEEAWRTIAREEGIRVNPSWPMRLRGVDRMKSLEIILEGATRTYTQAEQTTLAERKNSLYLRAIESVSPRDLAPGALALINRLRERGVRIAVASSSRNAPVLIDRLGLRSLLDAVADGSDGVPAKPDAALFLLAADRAGVPADSCLVIEDAGAGIEAARRAGMRSIFIGPAESAPPGVRVAPSLAGLGVEHLEQE